QTDDWSQPVRVAALSSTKTDLPGGSDGDRLSFILSSRREGLSDIFMATRTQVDSEWADVTRLPINSNCEDRGPSLNENGLILLWSSNGDARCGSLDYDLHVAFRQSNADTFTFREENQVALSAVNSPTANEGDPWLSPDGSYLVLASDRDGNPSRLYQTYRE
ncbi:MAG: hypothetical protein AAGC55_13710, partial [Myxococcota bacterium]